MLKLHFNYPKTFLTFVKKEKRFSYAASIGIANIPKSYHKEYKKYLVEFNSISVREERGKEIIQDLIHDKNVYVHIDPTMLLSKNEWDKIIKLPTIYVPKKYIFCYFLGQQDEKQKKMINNFAKQYNFTLLPLSCLFKKK